jgi:hypothetical protein
MSEEHDAFTEPGSSERMGEPLGADKVLSLVCVLWLLNSASGARRSQGTAASRVDRGPLRRAGCFCGILQRGRHSALARTPNDGHASDLHDTQYARR